MPTHIDILAIRRDLGRDEWQSPEPYGPDGWTMLAFDGRSSIVISYAEDGDTAWIHASRTADGRVPTYEEMCILHLAVWGYHGYAYQVHPPAAQHVNIHEYALHLWGRADGKPVLPEFGRFGTI